MIKDQSLTKYTAMSKMKKVYLLVFFLCLMLLGILLYNLRGQENFYYIFPGNQDAIELEIPREIIASRSCETLINWMKKNTPSELVEELPTCPWNKKGLVGHFKMNNTLFCVPRDYLSIRKFKLSGEIGELHIQFDFDSLSPVPVSNLIHHKPYVPQDNISIILVKHQETIKNSQTHYWQSLMTLLRRYNYQPQNMPIELTLKERNYLNTGLDYYVVTNFERCCIVQSDINMHKESGCYEKGPNIFIRTGDNPVNPEYWIQCYNNLEYLDLVKEHYTCEFRTFDSDDYSVEILFNQSKYLMQYKNVISQSLDLVNRFKSNEYCPNYTLLKNH